MVKDVIHNAISAINHNLSDLLDDMYFSSS